MASTIQLKTGTGSAVPSSLTQGEVAINVDNGLFYYGSGSTNTPKQLESFTNITASNLDISGDVDVDGTLEADAITVNGTALSSVIAGTTVANAVNTSNVNIAATTDNADFFITMVDGATSDQKVESSTKLKFNPSNGNLFVDGHITASGAISASGILSIPGFTNVSASLAAATAGGGTITGVTAGTGLSGGGTAGTVTLNIGQDVATTSNVQFANITSSGNISASGDLSALDLNLFGGGLSIKNQGAQSYARFYCESNNAHYTEVKAQPHSQFSGNPTMLLPAYDFNFASPDFGSASLTATNITASGNISASGEIETNTVSTVSTVIGSDAATNVDTFATSTYNGAIYDYILKDSTVGARAGQFMVAHDDGDVTFTDTSTKHLSDSTIPEITADISGGSTVRIRVTNGNGYTFKAFAKKL